ncbi:hypothetical protein CCACVL1_00283 [Corchorus capsularis]|uniref:Uncharacterized protein n=1 Tax=Corchorus capsularis TaxID=210143 RepID=A0A1R3KXF4_COCAP|nr:hypothetical protein CCACVL1_00283 [Corchorus capsularis]
MEFDITRVRINRAAKFLQISAKGNAGESFQSQGEATVKRKPGGCYKSGANVVKIECDEGLEINADTNPVHHEGDMPICNMQNQHLTQETCNANDGGDKSDDFWQSLITEFPGKVLEEAGEKIQNSGYIQDTTNLQD